jgi:hypothetical protein
LLSRGHATVDTHEVGQLTKEQWGVALDRVLALRDGGNDEKFFDIGFTPFQADPLAEIERLYDWLGRDLTAEAAKGMAAWRADNPRDKHGTHSYDGADFGMSDATLAARFGAYRERFGPFLH